MLALLLIFNPRAFLVKKSQESQGGCFCSGEMNLFLFKIAERPDQRLLGQFIAVKVGLISFL